MARVAVLHNTLDLRGGADAVCLHVCAALRADHEVTLYTLSRASPRALGRFFGVEVGADLRVRTPRGTTLLNRGLDAVADRVGPQLPARSVLLDRFFRREAGRYDLAVSTANEFALPLPSVQYVHYPQFRLRRIGEGGRFNPLWTRLAGVDRLAAGNGSNSGPGSESPPTTLLANSAWTAGVVERLYGRRPAVLHPPVDPISDPLPWGERELGVVTVGRLAPDKRPLTAVRIVEGVRERGHDLHLHVVGSASPTYREYTRRVRRAAAERDWVHLEEEASRDRLDDLLRRHRYGLAAKPDEHFGMAVAEYVAAGMVAFAPDSGGQVDVLDGRPERLFGSVSAAVDRVATAVERDDRPSLPRDRFDRERFHRAVRDRVVDTLRR
ncbi:glycosyltransferase [Halobium salinum]|uniref:Glycosyltransferase n=1 Tax=Halobium salinum TaxID=1364940 RepID=A0ABD5PCD9_9EURY|nr:glycosyltransferase [Halobium salinum]